MKYLQALIRDIPDFPKAGIIFKDITPLLADARALSRAVVMMAEPFRNRSVTLVVGAEARGFIFGPLVARELAAGFVPVRKPGKLPYRTRSEAYELEYGTDALEIHEDAISSGDNVLLVDDLLATGGTMAACCRLVESMGGKVVGCSFLVELSFLGGRSKLEGHEIASVIQFKKDITPA